MPVWLERLITRNAGIEYLPLLLCLGAAVAVWWWQSTKGRRLAREGGGSGVERNVSVLRVGWGPGLAIVTLVVFGVAAFATMSGGRTTVAGEVWQAVREDPWLVAWWVMGVGGAVMVWGVAVHAWRAEARLTRQCRRCRYDMTGIPGQMKCPECGRVARSERQFYPINVRRWALWIGAAVVALGLVMPTAITVLNRGWAAALPSGMLLRWAVATGDPPEGVLLELNQRARIAPDEWQTRLGERRDQLAMRMLESPSSTRMLYMSLLQVHGSVAGSPAVAQAAREAALSDDTERRRAGLAVMVLSSRERLPFEKLAPLLTDTDAATAQNATSMLVMHRAEYIKQLTPPGGVRDTANLRLFMRVMTDRSGYAFPHDELVMALRSDPDPEIAARATLTTVGCILNNGKEMTVGDLRAVVLAIAYVNAIGPKQRTAWESPVCYSSLPSVGAAVRTLIDDADPAVRRALFAQMTAFSDLYPDGVPGSMDGTIKPFRMLEEFLPRLRERLTKENDAAAKQQLEKLIESVEGKPVPEQEP